MPIDFEPEPHVAQLVERTAAFVRKKVLGMVQQFMADTEIHLAASRGRYLAEVQPFRIYDGPFETHRWSIGRRVVRNVKRAKDGQS